MENKELNLEQGDYKLKDGIYLRKQKDNYRLIYPPKKDLSQPFNLKNIHWGNFIGFHNWLNILIIILVIFMSLMYMHDTEQCREMMKNPYSICGYQFQQTDINLINFTDAWKNTTWGENLTKEGDVIDEYNISLHT